MLTKTSAAVALAALLAAALAAPAWSQKGPQKAAARSVDPDTGPASAAPDPLTPPEVSGPAPAAPGAANASTATASSEADPVIALIRQRLAAGSAARGEHRDDWAGLAAFYGETARPIWVGTSGFTTRAEAAASELRKADDWGLKASAFDVPANPGGAASPEALADAEIKLSAAVLKYARHARGGRLDPRSVSRIFDQKPSIFDPKTVLQGIAASPSSDAYLRGLHPQHPQFEKLRQALLAARNARREAEPPPPIRLEPGPSLKPGTEHEQVALLRQRLSAPASDGNEALYDDALAAAVKAYQKQRGLSPTGIVTNATRNALNDTGSRAAPGDNARRLVLNMERWRWMPEKLGEFYVWDSIPDQMTSVVRGGEVLLKEKIVVGKLGSPTPVFSADMQFIIFHPSWGVPGGIKQYELGPQLRKSGGNWFFGGTACG
jgi:murein L,D-transpeptidase YcbB/YkuD